MGVVAGLVNKPNQSAEEIVQEMASEAYQVLENANRYISAKL